MEKNKRITFDKYDAKHLYELTLENFQKGCYNCNKIKERLEKFIGDKDVKHIKEIVKKYPYCNDKK